MKRILRILALSVFSAGIAISQGWDIVVVDSNGMRPSVGVDSEGIPHIVYFKYRNGGGIPAHDSTIIMYATWNPASGDYIVEPIVEGAFHPQADLVFDRENHPHFVSHWHAPHGDAFHSMNDGSAWVHDPIPTEGHDGFSVAIALDESDRPHVSFVDSANERDPNGPGVEYAHHDGSGWISEPIGSGRYLTHLTGTSIALDHEGNPAISYYDSAASGLMFGMEEGGIWSIEMIDANGDAGRSSSLQFDSDGSARMSYLVILSETVGVIRLATASAKGWTFRDLDTLYSLDARRAGSESLTSLVVASNFTYVAYSDQHMVGLAIVDDFEITKERVFEYHDGILGQSTSLALDSGGVPHISFYIDLGDSMGACVYATREGSNPELPLPPVLVSPDSGATQVSPGPVLLWYPSEWAEYYDVQLSDSTAFSVLIADAESLEATSLEVSGLSNHTTYYWRVRAGNPLGASPWSAVWSFRTVAMTPLQVELISPSSGAPVDTDTVTLLWHASQPAGDRYWYEYATDSLFVGSTVDSAATDTSATVRGLRDNSTYWWRVRSGNEAGWGQFSETWSFLVPVTGVVEDDNLPEPFNLMQNYPNPFNPSTTIRYSLRFQTRVRLEVLNMLGQRVTTLVDQRQNAGHYEVMFNPSSLSSGTYFYRLEAGEFVETRRMILVK